MRAEEKFLKDVMLLIGNKVNEEQMEYIEMILLNNLDNYSIEEIEEKKQLPSDITLRNEMFLKQFLISISIQGLSEKTAKAYMFTVQKFLSYANIDVLNPDINEIKRYLAYLKLKGNKQTTIQNNRLNLSAFFQWMADEQYIGYNPMKAIKPIKVKKVIRKPLTNVEIAKLKDACITKREKALIEFMLSTGARREEITKVKLSDVDFHNNRVLLDGKGNKQRYVYMSDVANMYIREYLEERYEKNTDCEYLFCTEIIQFVEGKGQIYKQLSTEALARAIKKISDRAGVEKNHPHKFRRTFACNMLKQSDLMTVANLLGHSKLDTTKIYLELDESKSEYECNKRVIF